MCVPNIVWHIGILIWVEVFVIFSSLSPKYSDPGLAQQWNYDFCLGTCCDFEHFRAKLAGWCLSHIKFRTVIMDFHWPGFKDFCIIVIWELRKVKTMWVATSVWMPGGDCGGSGSTLLVSGSDMMQYYLIKYNFCRGGILKSLKTLALIILYRLRSE